MMQEAGGGKAAEGRGELSLHRGQGHASALQTCEENGHVGWARTGLTWLLLVPQ